LQLSMAVLSDSIEQREALQSRLEFEATHDALTGVGNRSSLTSALNRMRDDAAGSTGMVAVTFIDLDDFKDINDRHGHHLGDEVLKVIATRMVDVAAAPALVARLGGDEFVIAMDGVASIDEPIELARRVIDAVSRPIEISGRTLEVRASAGVAVAGGGGGVGGADATPIEPSALLHMADLAVYSAKLNPDDDVALYDDELDRHLVHEREIEASVRVALADGCDELYLVYQPIMSADGTEVPAVEALLRWTKPGVGPIFPDQFIPIAESSDLIIDVDAWVIEAALRQLSAWVESGFVPPIAVAVNISGRSLLDRGFVDRVARARWREKAPPALDKGGVNGSAPRRERRRAATQLGELRELGIRVAIDDFGTGYTSVAHLRALPVDELKIDGSFVQELDEQENGVLIEMITQLAHQLHLPVVAEGVETLEQVEVLRAIGCDRLQGYHFSRPLEPEALEAWILEHSAHAGPQRLGHRMR
jgi:diguanylate cyclase (GGDEF)-like protein